MQSPNLGQRGATPHARTGAITLIEIVIASMSVSHSTTHWMWVELQEGGGIGY